MRTVAQNCAQFRCVYCTQLLRNCAQLNSLALETRVSTGIPGYGLRTEMIRKFFPFPLWKRFRNDFFSVKRKFPERCYEITDRYGIPERSGTFRNIVPEIFWKIVPEISGFRNIWYQNYFKVLHM